ncbi:MAG: HEAT repeat domain-containing protein [Parachlamydiales bacterium]
MDDFSLIEEELLEILLHRECHFAGQFSVMLDYYRQGGPGVFFDIEEVVNAAAIEEAAGENLAPLLFSETEIRTVAKVRSLYQGLRELCEQEGATNPKLIASLILAEGEEEEAIDAVVSRAKEIVPELIQLATSADFANPLFPGYGQAPLLAIRALGRIQDPRAIVPLFELIGSEGEEEAISTLVRLPGALPFLLQRLTGRPFTQDTERAVIALSTLPPTPEIREAFNRLLREEQLPPKIRQYLQD